MYRVCAKGKTNGRPRVSEDNVEQIRESFQCSPCKSTNHASRKLKIPQNNRLAGLETAFNYEIVQVAIVTGLKR